MDACLPTDYRPPSPTLATAVLYGERRFVYRYASREQHVSSPELQIHVRAWSLAFLEQSRNAFVT